jgi:hypothetical protein
MFVESVILIDGDYYYSIVVVEEETVFEVSLKNSVLIV